MQHVERIPSTSLFLIDIVASASKETGEFEADGPHIAPVAAKHHVTRDIPQFGLCIIKADTFKLERIEQGTDTKAREPILTGVACLKGSLAVVGVITLTPHETKSNHVHIVSTIRAIELLRQEETLVFQVHTPLVGNSYRQLHAQHRLKVVIGLICYTVNSHRVTHQQSKAYHWIERHRILERLVVDMEECGVEVPFKLRTYKREQRVVPGTVLE